KLFATSGLSSAFFSSALRRSTIARGVPLGAKHATQAVNSYPGIASASGGTFGKCVRALSEVTAIGGTRSARRLGITDAMVAMTDWISPDAMAMLTGPPPL